MNNRGQLEAIGGLLLTIIVLYLLFDFFWWDGGLVNPSIMSMIGDALA